VLKEKKWTGGGGGVGELNNKQRRRGEGTKRPLHYASEKKNAKEKGRPRTPLSPNHRGKRGRPFVGAAPTHTRIVRKNRKSDQGTHNDLFRTEKGFRPGKRRKDRRKCRLPSFSLHEKRGEKVHLFFIRAGVRKKEAGDPFSHLPEKRRLLLLNLLGGGRLEKKKILAIPRKGGETAGLSSYGGKKKFRKRRPKIQLAGEDSTSTLF